MSEHDNVKQLLKDLPPLPWTLTLNKQTGETEMKDRTKKTILKIPKNKNHLLLANFIQYAPERFEALIK